MVRSSRADDLVTGAVSGAVDGVIVGIILFDFSLGALTEVVAAGAFFGAVIAWAWRQ